MCWCETGKQAYVKSTWEPRLFVPNVTPHLPAVTLMYLTVADWNSLMFRNLDIIWTKMSIRWGMGGCLGSLDLFMLLKDILMSSRWSTGKVFIFQYYSSGGHSRCVQLVTDITFGTLQFLKVFEGNDSCPGFVCAVFIDACLASQWRGKLLCTDNEVCMCLGNCQSFGAIVSLVCNKNEE